MAINERLIHTAADVAAGGTNAEQNLILHLDANDVDSYDGDGSVWYDISEHDVTIPLSDNADNLELHLNASDSNSYSGSGTTWTDLTSNNNATVVASTYDIDNGGYFDITSNTVTFSSNTSALDTATFSFEMWVYQTSTSGTQYLFSDTGISLFTISGTQMRFVKGFSGTNNDDGYFNPTGNSSGWTTNKWNHIAVTFSSTTSKVYINGVLVQTHTEGSGTPTALTTLQISPSLSRWKGYLSAFRVYDITLSASEVGQNYRHGRDYIYTALAGTPFLHYDPANSSSYSGTGTTLTDLAGNNNADLLGGIESSYDEELGNSFDITGSGDGITTSSVVSINPANGMTIEMWFKIDSDTQSYLFTFDGTATSGYGLSYRSNLDKVMFFYKTGASTNDNITSPTVTVDKWHHLVATTDGNGAQIYLDGEVGETTTSNAWSNAYNEDLHFGNHYDLSQASNVQIGQIRFYKGHLTADEVMQNYLFTKNNYPNANHLTLYNSPSFEPTSPNYLRFDSANDEARLSSVSIPIEGGFTLSVYIRRHTSVSGYHHMLRLTGTGYTSYLFLIAGNSDVQYFVGNSGTGNSISTFGDGRTWTNNEWIHVLYTKENGNGSTNRGEIYINGTSIKTATNLSDNTDITNVYINRDASFPTTRNAQCDVGYMKIYDKSFTDAEALAEFNATKDDYGL